MRVGCGGCVIVWLAGTAFAGGAVPIVAIGDGLLPASSAPGPGGWVAVVADCLEERRAGAFTVVDRAVPGGDPGVALGSVGGALELAPQLVLVGLAPPHADDVAAFKAQVDALVAALIPRVGAVVLVGVADPGGRPEWGAALDELVAAHPGVVHVDAARDWAAPERATLIGAGGVLTDQGHARVGGAVCDAILAWSPPPK
jgi:hypothetical protein